MSDVYEERNDMSSASYITHKLRDLYNSELIPKPVVRDGNTEVDHHHPDVQRRRSQLSLRWPGEELVAQIIKDAAAIMAEHNIDPKDVRF